MVGVVLFVFGYVVCVWFLADLLMVLYISWFVAWLLSTLGD